MIRGPLPSDVKVACPDCGKVRFYHRSFRGTGRCQSCASRHWQQIRIAQMKINVLTFAEKTKVVDLIRAKTEPDGDKHVRYIDGLTDATLAEQAAKLLGRPVTEQNVFNLRLQVVGKFRTGAAGPHILANLAKAQAAKAAKRAAARQGIASDDVAAIRADIAELRAAVQSIGEMVEHMQKVAARRPPLVAYGNGANARA